MTTTINTTSTSNIDRLGQLLALIAGLTKEADAIKDAIKDAASAGGDKVIEGTLFRATYMEVNRSVVDWKGVSSALNIPPELIAKYTKTTAVFSVKVAAL